MREKWTTKLQRILANLKGGKIVQNRQLKVVSHVEVAIPEIVKNIYI